MEGRRRKKREGGGVDMRIHRFDAMRRRRKGGREEEGRGVCGATYI